MSIFTGKNSIFWENKTVLDPVFCQPFWPLGCLSRDQMRKIPSRWNRHHFIQHMVAASNIGALIHLGWNRAFERVCIRRCFGSAIQREHPGVRLGHALSDLAACMGIPHAHEQMASTHQFGYQCERLFNHDVYLRRIIDHRFHYRSFMRNTALALATHTVHLGAHPAAAARSISGDVLRFAAILRKYSHRLHAARFGANRHSMHRHCDWHSAGKKSIAIDHPHDRPTKAPAIAGISMDGRQQKTTRTGLFIARLLTRVGLPGWRLQPPPQAITRVVHSSFTSPPPPSHIHPSPPPSTA
jgi:hypothetical protein